MSNKNFENNRNIIIDARQKIKIDFGRNFSPFFFSLKLNHNYGHMILH